MIPTVYKSRGYSMLIKRIDQKLIQTWTTIFFLLMSEWFSFGILPAIGVAGERQPIIESIIAPATPPGNLRNSHGDILVLNDGTLLAAWSDFYGGSSSSDSPARISAATSVNGGRTWSHHFTLRENIGRQNIKCVNFLRLPSGEILLFHLVNNSPDDIRLVITRSTDETKSWSAPLEITSQRGYHMIANSRVVRLKTGRILCPVTLSRSNTTTGPFQTVIYFSDDDGHTWKKGQGTLSAPQRGAMDPALLELTDGRVLQIIRTQVGKLWHSYSLDHGNTWSPAKPWDIVAPEAPATIARIPNTGEIILIYNPNFTQGADHGGERTPLAVVISSDEGKTWTKPRLIESDKNFNYSYVSVTFLGDRVMLTYYIAPQGNDLESLKFKSFPITWFLDQ